MNEWIYISSMVFAVRPQLLLETRLVTWSGSGGIQAWSLTTNWFPSMLWHCWFAHLACKNRPQNDLLCVEWDVKPYTLTQTHLVLDTWLEYGNTVFHFTAKICTPFFLETSAIELKHNVQNNLSAWLITFFRNVTYTGVFSSWNISHNSRQYTAAATLCC